MTREGALAHPTRDQSTPTVSEDEADKIRYRKRVRHLRSVVAAAYRAQQFTLRFPAVAAQRTVRMVTKRGFQPSPANIKAAQERYQALLARDLANVEAGLYPRALLFQFPLTGYLRAMPSFLRDVPRSFARLQAKNFRDLPKDADLESYPPYYRRNFHWQTDGYLSDHSAKIYDLGVEWLFMGTADIMRRQVIPPISRFLMTQNTLAPTNPTRLIDIGCGTGRTLSQIATAHPKLQLVGVDLSPYYLRRASQLPNLRDATMMADNGESLSFRDDSFSIATSVFMFHELHKDARRNVMHEMFRVLRPGGLAVIADSAQSSESPELAPFLGRFTVDFHEPYYKSYQQDPLEEALTDIGFEAIEVESHFVSKIVIAHKPYR